MKRKFRLFPEKYKNFPLFWLVYMVFPICNIYIEELPKAIIGYALVLLFIWIYRDSYWKPDNHLLHLILQLCIVFIFCIYFNPMFIYMAFYPANLIGALKSVIQIVCFIIFEIIIFITSILYHQVDPSSALFAATLAPLTMLVISPFAVRASLKYQRIQQQLNTANKQIEELVKQAERQRIARDLHDILGHTLSLITLKSELVERLIRKSPDQAVIEVKEIKDTSRATLKQVRELVSDLNMMKLSEEVAHSRSILSAANIKLTVMGDIKNIANNMSKLNENIMSMCLREAVTNVVKHSMGSECLIDLKIDSGNHMLTVTDNGKGIEQAENKGNGLYGMIERLKLIEGSFLLKSNEGKGTKIIITIPAVIRKAEVTG